MIVQKSYDEILMASQGSRADDSPVTTLSFANDAFCTVFDNVSKRSQSYDFCTIIASWSKSSKAAPTF